MSDLNVASIQSGLGMSLAKFGKICHIVQEEVEQAGLERKTLWTNQVRKDFDILAEKIRLKGRNM